MFCLSSGPAIKFWTARRVFHDGIFYGEVFPRLQMISLTGLCIFLARLLVLRLGLLVATIVIRCRGWRSRRGGIIFRFIVVNLVVVQLVLRLVLVLCAFISVFIVFVVVLFGRFVFLIWVLGALWLF